MSGCAVVGWMTERDRDESFPRLHRHEADADYWVGLCTVHPPVTKRPVYAIDGELQSGLDRLAAENAGLKGNLDQVRGYLDTLTQRCVDDTAEIGELRAEVERLREVVGLPGVLEEYEAQTKALPCQHEDSQRGASSYNWRMGIIADLRAMLAAAPQGEHQ